MRSVAKQAVFHENENAVLQMTHKNSLLRKKHTLPLPWKYDADIRQGGERIAREEWIAHDAGNLFFENIKTTE